jgi:hypothetical protein
MADDIRREPVQFVSIHAGIVSKKELIWQYHRDAKPISIGMGLKRYSTNAARVPKYGAATKKLK